MDVKRQQEHYWGLKHFQPFFKDFCQKAHTRNTEISTYVCFKPGPSSHKFFFARLCAGFSPKAMADDGRRVEISEDDNSLKVNE